MPTPFADSRGFTIIELMLVIAVVGILAAIAIPQYQTYVTRAKIAEGFELAGPLKKTIAAYYDRWGVLPADNQAAGLPAPEALRGEWVASIAVEHGAIAVHFDPKLQRDAKAELVLHLRPALNRRQPTAALVWVCETHAPPAGFEVPGGQPAPVLPPALLSGPCRT